MTPYPKYPYVKGMAAEAIKDAALGADAVVTE